MVFTIFRGFSHGFPDGFTLLLAHPQRPAPRTLVICRRALEVGTEFAASVCSTSADHGEMLENPLV
jgi:hypothetical protein